MKNLIENKKGQWQLLAGLGIWPIVAILVFGIIMFFAVGSFVKNNIMALVGATVIILSLIYGFRGNTTKTKGNFMLIFIIIGVFLVLGQFVFLGTQQSYFSQSTVQLNNGQYFWLLTGTANNIDEGYTFSYVPQTQTMPDGTKVQPQSSLNLKISKLDSYCQYNLISEEQSFCLGAFNMKYYLLANAQRTANIQITDGNGKSTIMDATISGATSSISNGQGTVTIQTQGILAGKTDCPNYASVAVFPKDNGYIIGSTSDVDYVKSQIGGLNCLNYINAINALFAKVTPNQAFTSSFSSAPVIDGTSVKGNIDIGSGIFSITADQKYFNSVVLTPPQLIQPSIVAINVPAAINQGTSSSISVDLTNKVSGSGVVQITTTSNDVAVSPSSKSVTLSGPQRVVFGISVPNKVETTSVCFKVCSSSQFGGSNCDNKCQNINIVSSSTSVVGTCGDGICQSNENSASCPNDCATNGTGSCSKWYQVSGTQTTYGFSLFGIVNLFPTTKPVCKTADWVYFAIFIGAVLIIVIVYLLLIPSKRNRRK